VLKIPNVYAKEHNLILLNEESMDPDRKPKTTQKLVHKIDVDLSVLQEMYQLLGPLNRIEQSNEEFKQASHEDDSKSELDASTLFDHLEDDIELARLLEDMPASEDLLEMNDNAPVIRMINSLLRQV
jgi:general secretion pathway protein E